MPDQYTETYIRRVPMFQNLPEPQFQKVAQAFLVRRYNPGEIIFYEGTPARGLHIFVDGQAVLLRTGQDGTPQSVGLVRAGNFINDQAVFRDDGIQTATLQAVREVTALLLTRDAMNNLLTYEPDVARAFGIGTPQSQPAQSQPRQSQPPQSQPRQSQPPQSQPRLFKTQRENEEVLLITRRHWWAYARWGWVPLLVFLLAIGLTILTASIPIIAAAIGFVGFLIAAGISAYLYLEWRNDAVIITDHRVIRITHTILTFSEVISEIAIESIQEANAEIPSFAIFARIFGYGDVELITAGREGNLILDFMPRPDDLQELILEDQRNRKQAIQQREQHSIRADLDRWINQNNNPQNASGERAYGTEDSLTNIWKEGTGPLSPFVKSFRTTDGSTVYRKHWVVWVGRIFAPSLWLLGTLIFALLLLVIEPLQVLGVIGFVIAFVMLLIGVVWWYLSDWDWRHDYYVISDTHVSIVNRRPFFLQDENDQVLLKQVDNVVAESHGMLQRLLQFGDVRLSLVGADHAKVFDDVGDPVIVQSEITRRQARAKQIEEQQRQDNQREIIGEYLSAYHNQMGNNGPASAPGYYDPRNQPQAMPPQPNRPYPTPPYPQASPQLPPDQPQRPNRPSISQGRRMPPGGQGAAPPNPQQPYMPPSSENNQPQRPAQNGSNRPPKFPTKRQ